MFNVNKAGKSFKLDSNLVILFDPSSPKAMDVACRKLKAQTAMLRRGLIKKRWAVTKGQKRRIAINDYLIKQRKLDKLKLKYKSKGNG